MNANLGEQIETVEVASIVGEPAFQVFGLRWSGPSGLDYATLDESLASGSVEVTEVSDSGTVRQLKVMNRSPRMLFLMAGEHLVGAKQNRVLNASLMVGPNSELAVPVSCVERGRWGYRSQHFGSSETTSHSLMRKMISKQAHDGYRQGGMPSSDQGEVWNEVARKLASLGSESGTSAYEQAYHDHRKAVTDLIGAIHAPKDCFGAVFVVQGKIAGADLFDQPATLGKLWPKLIRGYAMDAIEPVGTQPPPVETPEKIARWLRDAAKAPIEPFPSPGLGTDLRLKGTTIFGAGLVVEGQAVHLELFPEAASQNS